ncbi:polyamine transporter tpo5 [Naganishia albida]|nr:polyamine transporter tpo5 [Naganishia albida]
MSMPTLEKDGAAKSSAEPVDGSTTYQRSGFYDNADGDMAGDDASLSAGSQDTDEAALARLGYKSEMMREFGNLSTFSFAFSIMGMCSSIATTFNTPLLYGGGPASVVWCWLIGSIFNTTLGASVAEIVSAYPTSGGVYTASASLVPRKHRAIVGWTTGWLNLLGQTAGVASTEFGLAQMIWAGCALGKDGDFVVTTGMQFGLFVGLLIVHGFLNSLKTRDLAFLTQGFVFVNIGMTLIIIIVLLATTGRENMHPASYVFTQTYNFTGWQNNGLAFMFGLLSVQWTMTDYDAAAHISEEVKKAAIAAPVAIFVAVVGTGALGWVLNVVMVLCSGDIADLPGISGSAFLTIMANRMGKTGALILWPFVCLVAFFTVQTATQACARTFYAFSRDGGLPDRGLFGRLNSYTKTPVWSVWLVIILSVAMGALSWASLIAAQAIFSMCAVAMDLSYVIPVVCRRWYSTHPEVKFRPGPFYMGNWGLYINIIMVSWTFFECIILAFPTVQPITATNFNYSSIITIGVMVLSGIWYVLGGRRHYHGPKPNLGETHERHTENNMLPPIKDEESSEKDVVRLAA